MRFRSGSAFLPALLLLLLCRPNTALAQCGTPRIFCPDDITVTGCDPGGGVVNYPLPTASNDCGPLGVILESGPPPGSLFPFGTTEVTYRTDSQPFATCSFHVTVDLPQLFIDCPDDMVVETCDQNGAIVNYPIPTASSDCGPLGVLLDSGPASGSLFPIGTTDVKFRTDSQPFAYCTFRVTVNLLSSLRIFCPDDIVVTACEPGGATVNYPTPTGENDCGPLGTVLESGLPSGSLFPFGTTMVKWRTDSQPFALCTFSVTVEVVNPDIECPDDITVFTCNPAGAVVEYPTPAAGSVCGPLDTFLEEGLPSGSLFPMGTTTVKWRSAGHQATGVFAYCFFDVTVLEGDVVPPTIDCPEGITAIAEPGQTSAAVEYRVKASDDCPGDVTVVCVPPSGSTFSCGSTPVTCTATDKAGNQSSCTFTVTVALPVALDIRPGGCPNPLKSSEQGVIPVAIVGTGLFDVSQVDPATVRLEGVAPLRWDREDVAAPFFPLVGKSDCLDCSRLRKDRIGDMTFKFSAPDLVAALGMVTHGECRVVRLTGETLDGCPIAGEDVVRIQVMGAQLQPISEPAAPGAYALYANHPNPFLFRTRIGYEMAAAGHARLAVYDVQGREVKVIVDGVRLAGSHDEVWDGTDVNGAPVVSGAYFYDLTVDPMDGGEEFHEVRKMIVSR